MSDSAAKSSFEVTKTNVIDAIFSPLNRVYGGVAGVMNSALSDVNIANTRKMFAEYQEENGGSFAFGTFANYYFKKMKTYKPGNEADGLPSTEEQWLKDAFSFDPADAKKIVGWVTERLENDKFKILFAVTSHEGDTTVLFFPATETSQANVILIACKRT